MTATLEKKMTVEEYIEFETTSELRHEYINGQLFEMPGEKLFNLKITAFLAAYLMYLLQEKAISLIAMMAKLLYQIRINTTALTLLLQMNLLLSTVVTFFMNRCLLPKVISKTSRIRDTVDKYNDYTKIYSLKYYLLIDPERTYVTVYSKNTNGQWEADAYNDIEEVIQLPLLNVELPLKRFFHNNNRIMIATLEKKMTVEEYIEFETTSEIRHEYINGQLFEMPGEKKLNGKVAAFLSLYLMTLLAERGYIVYSHDYKVAIPDEDKYYYPDLVVTNEPEDLGSEYVIYQPELLVEIISKTSHTRDTVEKYINYTKIPSLKYYFIIDPVRNYITVHSKDEKGEWEVDAYSNKEEVIQLPLLGLELPLVKIFK